MVTPDILSGRTIQCEIKLHEQGATLTYSFRTPRIIELKGVRTQYLAKKKANDLFKSFKLDPKYVLHTVTSTDLMEKVIYLCPACSKGAGLYGTGIYERDGKRGVCVCCSGKGALTKADIMRNISYWDYKGGRNFRTQICVLQGAKWVAKPALWINPEDRVTARVLIDQILQGKPVVGEGPHLLWSDSKLVRKLDMVNGYAPCVGSFQQRMKVHRMLKDNLRITMAADGIEVSNKMTVVQMLEHFLTNVVHP